MAEEEVLTEQIEVPKKEKSGMSPIVILLVLVIGIGVILAVLFMIMKAVGNIGDKSSAGEDVIKLTECTKEKKLKVIYITPQDSDKRSTFTLGNGDYFLAKLALCVNAKTPDTAITENMGPMMTIASEFFLKYQPDDIFKNYYRKSDEGAGSEEAGGDPLIGDDMSDAGKSTQERYREIRQRLADSLRANYDFIRDVYLYEIDVVPAMK